MTSNAYSDSMKALGWIKWGEQQPEEDFWKGYILLDMGGAPIVARWNTNKAAWVDAHLGAPVRTNRWAWWRPIPRA